jgi:hypothetical protein
MAGTLKLKRLKTELVNLLRWEDDGGKSTEPDYAIPGRKFIQPVRSETGMHDPFLQWNKQFVIKPFQAGTRIDLVRKKRSTNRPSM